MSFVSRQIAASCMFIKNIIYVDFITNKLQNLGVTNLNSTRFCRHYILLLLLFEDILKR